MRIAKSVGVVVVCLGAGLAAACGETSGVAPSALSTTSGSQGVTANAGSPNANASPNALVAEARQATTQYHDQAVAIADGYVADTVCVSSPMGGMGFHYINPALAGAVGVDPMKPEAVLYAPKPDGSRKLVAVEWVEFVRVRLPDGTIVPWVSPNAPDWSTVVTTRPSLFGQPFDGPMPGHNPEMPWHYELHVWAWEANPSGLFASWNPNVSCTP